MTKRNILIGGVIIIAIILFVIFQQFRSLTSFPTSEEAGVSFQTIQSSRPDGSSCLNEAGNAGLAKELINMQSRIIVVGAGEGSMPDAEWADYKPSLPWQKNIDRHTMFDDSCFYRSPEAPVNCEGDACRINQEYDGYEWMELSIVDSQDCLPTPDADCSAIGVDEGAISVTVTRKCHQLVYEDEIFELVDIAGNRYVMHATDSGTPDLNAAIPAGWTLEKVSLDEPLEVLPFGGGDNCYHNVMRDNLGQGYHQYVFVGETYP